jgi:hypothetical protein
MALMPVDPGSLVLVAVVGILALIAATCGSAIAAMMATFWALTPLWMKKKIESEEQHEREDQRRNLF